jgi:DNA invertase Pin-like site-specific DNA recombinase
MRKRKASAAERFDVVLIRKSTHAQDDQAQTDNVRAMLKAEGVYVADGHWYTVTVTRANVQGNEDFQRILRLVETDRVRTAYIECQDRWGTDDVFELFTLLGLLAAHGTALYDLREKVDLTGKDDATQIRAFLGGLKSKKEREDLSYRSLRSRVNNFLATGSWPTGPHPYGYGKRCYAPDGTLLWEWHELEHPQRRKRVSAPPTGQLFVPDASGALHPTGPNNVRIPRKARGEIIKLAPSNDPSRVRAVRRAFDLFTRVGLSRRQIAVRLNAEGLTLNGGPFTHLDVRNILKNPAYAGDTVFGRVQTGKLNTFDAKGLLQKVDGQIDGKHRDPADCLIKRDTHPPLIDRKTFDLAQAKLAADKERISFSPRNPAYFLKQLLVCGHCGRGMLGRTEIEQTTRRRTVVYVCSSHHAGRQTGQDTPCGRHRITHEEAERLLLDKIHELGLPLDEIASEQGRANLRARLERLGLDGDEADHQYDCWIEEGVAAFVEYLKTTYNTPPESLRRLQTTAFSLYTHGWLPPNHVAALPADPAAPLPDVAEANKVSKLTAGHKAALAEFKAALKEAEQAAVAEARRKLAGLRDEHKTLTLAWAKATDDMQGVLKAEIDRLESEIREWEPRTVPLSERMKELVAAEKGREAERKQLLSEWPTLEGREKGEALRRLFRTVKLYWRRTWHPRKGKPARPQKTERPGRFSYELEPERTVWAYAVSDLDNASRKTPCSANEHEPAAARAPRPLPSADRIPHRNARGPCGRAQRRGRCRAQVPPSQSPAATALPISR